MFWIFLGIVLVALIGFFGKALLMVLGAVLELITGLLSSGCFWIVVTIVVVIALLFVIL